ncbi:sugar ABC transporter permease [Streptomyces sp. SL13]|jgi:N-acetylglucosamine transport system permease protein|uniref:Sugar ABC transporter permease n=1 Tax=Streptantibioticus silvisoli TaxID=2705255 RepID=A0AA90H6E3_9ACTN|nr:sugar ABC transporter permease [Streptantibioticus silvisoli]MDI5971770.1 sugar ABC transporter permease [Streptantibioticus silvisoli]
MRHRRYPFIVGFLIVPVALYAVLVIWPYIQTFGYSLTDWSGESQTMHFIGLKNYTALLSDHVFLTALEHNGLLLVFLPVITILLALFFAFMLNVGGQGRTGGVQGVAGAAFYKVVFFFPQVLSVAILAVLFEAVYRSDAGGLLNGVLVKIGLENPQNPIEWLNDPGTVLWCLLAIMVWQGVGFYLVLFSAAMQSIPKEIFEAALLDGAGRAQTFFKVTMPLLWDSVQTAWVYLAIAAMDFFALVSTLTPGTAYGGGPDYHSEVLSTYLMRNFLYFGKSGYACAMGVVILFLTLIVSVLALRATRRERIEF